MRGRHVLALIILIVLGFTYYKLSQPDNVSLAFVIEGQGSISIGEGTHELSRGEEIKFSAEPQLGWQFAKWSGADFELNDQTINLQITEDLTLEAIFKPVKYQVNTDIIGAGQIVVEPKKDYYFYDQQITIVAEAEKGWEFVEWGNQDFTGNPHFTTNIVSDLTITAQFSRINYSIKTSIEGKGNIETSQNLTQIPDGTTISLKATSDPGWTFVSWSGDSSSRNNSLTINVDSDLDLKATFSPRPVLREGDRGNEVLYLQELLYQMNFLPSRPDSVFGLQTKLAVKKAQQHFGLSMDGIVGANTWAVLERPASETSHSTYRVQSGDSLWLLAQRWNTSVAEIIAVNNISNPNLLRAGATLNIPGSTTLVQVEDTHWNTVINLIPRGSTVMITDVETGLSFRIKRLMGTYHADVEPLTSRDTEVLRTIYGGSFSWDRRAVYVHVGSRIIAGSINGYPHGSQSIYNNNFNGHFCLHFRGSRLHLNQSVDAAHQRMVDKALNTPWSVGR